MHEYMTIEQAATWASENLKINIEPSNISYLIQYGKVKKIKKNGTTVVELNDLKSYYNSYYGKKELNWKKKLGDDLNWSLSFDNVKEKERTKHVHRLHPYKGKFIPQLVEYFLDNHTDQFKKEIFFKKGDVILDPFCGSGTTLVQANELGINAVGIDVSEFNALISNVKVSDHDLLKLEHYSKAMTHSLEDFVLKSNIMKFENELLDRLKVFNNKYFPSPDFKYRLRQNTLNEKE
ncbi:MAG: DNA methyltransferase, partial [Candidatus Zixiibacteriota bacterium]